MEEFTIVTTDSQGTTVAWTMHVSGAKQGGQAVCAALPSFSASLTLVGPSLFPFAPLARVRAHVPR